MNHAHGTNLALGRSAGRTCCRPAARVLDVACGCGRHMRWFAGAGPSGHRRRPRRASRRAAARHRPRPCWPTSRTGPGLSPGRRFDGVVVTNYLWRPLLPDIVAGVAPGGVLIYETFAAGNETVGKPSRPDFLLQPGELLARLRRACAWWPTRTASWTSRRALRPADRRRAAPPRPAHCRRRTSPC